MPKSANEVMEEVISAAVIDGIMAMKTASKGLPNTLLRDLNAVHANTTHADLPREVQAAIVASVRSAFTRLMKEGYSVSAGPAAAPRQFTYRRDDRGPPRGPATGQRPGGRPGNRRPPGKGPRPGGKPKGRPGQ